MTWEQGRSFRLSGCPAEAIKVLRQGLVAEVNDYRLHDEMGMALVELNRHEEAIGSFMTALRLKPDFDDACVKIGTAFAARGLHEPAAEWFLRARRMNPVETKYLYIYGCTLAALHNFQQATEIFDQWTKSKPDNPIAQHMVGAALGSRLITKASADYIRAHFDAFADGFERNLAKLNYCGPDLVVNALTQAAEAPAYGWDILDAGCGTGLVGIALKPLARRLIGVDLSSGMLNVARPRAIYDELIQIDILDYLRSHPQEFDVVSAADVLTYIGDLNDFFSQAAGALRPGGRVVVAVEGHKTGDDFRLNPSGRFSHSRHYLHRVIAGSGFTVTHFADDVMRHECRKPVATLVAVGVLPNA